MKKLITVCQVLVVIVVFSAIVAHGGAVIKGNFSEITLNGTKITAWDNVPGGSDNASLLTSGTVAKARGGFGASVDSASGIPVFTSGAISWKTVTTFLALVGVTFNSADNTWVFVAPISGTTGTFSGEVTAQQFSTTGVDNQFFVQVPNSGTPPIPASDNAGMIWFSTADNTLKITNATGAVGSVTVTW